MKAGMNQIQGRNQPNRKKRSGAGKMAQQVIATTKPEDLSSSPGSHVKNLDVTVHAVHHGAGAKGRSLQDSWPGLLSEFQASHARLHTETLSQN